VFRFLARKESSAVRLIVYTDYSLRLLMYLAVRNDRLATIGEVADAYGIAKSHLTKVAHQLGVAGYVGTVRGKGGGLRLAKPADQIGLGEIVRLTEPDMALVPCFQPLCAPCPIVPACGLRRALHEAQQAFLATLDRYNIAELVIARKELKNLLGLEHAAQGSDGPHESSARSRGRQWETQASTLVLPSKRKSRSSLP
jgi:Rrf2 family nitric oxide-sensitive transcriptional repressor